jgi:hypothetical protein
VASAGQKYAAQATAQPPPRGARYQDMAPSPAHGSRIKQTDPNDLGRTRSRQDPRHQAAYGYRSNAAPSSQVPPAQAPVAPSQSHGGHVSQSSGMHATHAHAQPDAVVAATVASGANGWHGGVAEGESIETLNQQFKHGVAVEQTL